MRKAFILLFVMLAYQCEQTPMLPKPKARLSLRYTPSQYAPIESACPYAFSMNQQAKFVPLKGCEAKVVYPNMKATVYLSYRPVQNNLDSLLSDAYQMPSKHIIKASEIPEKVFINPENRTYGTLFRIVGEAASQVQFFLTDSTNHFLVGSLYFYTRPNYDSLMPAARFIEKDMIKLMESMRWEASE